MNKKKKNIRNKNKQKQSIVNDKSNQENKIAYKGTNKKDDNNSKKVKGIDSTKTSKHSKIKHVIEAIIMIIIIIGAIVGISVTMFQHQKRYYASHARNHMSEISTNTLALGNKHFNGKHTIIFYEDACPHCQKVIPKVYAKNKLAMKHVQYRDEMPKTVDYNNEELGSKLGVKVVPTEVHLVAHHGKIVHYTKTSKIN